MKKSWYIFLLLLILPNLSWAHPNHLSFAGFSQGLLHPVSGLDHTLAMVAVGILGSQRYRLWIGTLPLTFMAFMMIGGFLGYMGITIPWVEFGISLSVLVLGLCITFPYLLSSLFLFALLTIFALCHGFAHGAEMPASAYWPYAVGFIVATGLLHLFGVVVGKMLVSKQMWILRFSGVTMAFATFWL